MKVRKYSAGITASTLLAAGLALTAVAPASADPSFVPDATAIVGVGSDTIEFVVGDLAAGKTINGVHVDGWNDTHPTQKIASYNATGTTPLSLRSTSAAPVARPNGSGQGKASLFGAGNNPDVNFARSSSSLSSTNGEAAALTQYPFAVDGLKMAVSGNVASHAPASLTIADIVKIYDGTYKTWGQIPGYSGAFGSATIHPLIPQSGSGTRSFFEAELKAANSNVTVVYGAASGSYPGVVETQEHSPTAIQNDADAIAPFSTARAQTLATPAAIHLEDGYNAKRAVYNVVRNADTGTSWATGIFGQNGFFCSAAAKPIIEANGFAQLASVANGGVCGSALTTAPANLNTNTVATTTTLTAATTATPGQVKLTATVNAGGQAADGKVDFFEGATKVGSVATLTGGQAVLTLSNVALGAHSYTAQFVSANAASFTNSTSSAAAADVKAAPVFASTVVGSSYGRAGSASVTITSAQPVSGTVTAKIGTLSLGTKALAAGKAAFAIPASLTAGTKAVVFTYSGNDAVAASSSTKVFARAKGAVALGETFAATVAKGKKATGTVSVKLTPGSSVKAVGGTVTIKQGSKVIGKGTVTAAGTVKLTLAKLGAKGKKTLTIVYSGSANTGAKTKSFTITQK